MRHCLGVQICLSLLLVSAFPLMGCEEKSQSLADTEPAATPTSEKQTSYPEPPPFTLSDINGNMVSLADFRGKVVLLDFFATWCEPCRVEIMGFIELYHKYQAKGFIVVGISTDKLGLEVVKPFVTELGIDYPVLIGNPEVIKTYRVIGLPTNYILDQQGRSRKYYVGIQPKAIFEQEILKVLDSQ